MRIRDRRCHRHTNTMRDGGLCTEDEIIREYFKLFVGMSEGVSYSQQVEVAIRTLGSRIMPFIIGFVRDG
jgi:hypothetical protein